MNEFTSLKYEQLQTALGAVVKKGNEYFIGETTHDRKLVPVSDRIGRLTEIGLTADNRYEKGTYANIKHRAAVRFVRNMITCHAFALLAEGTSLRNLTGALSRKAMMMKRIGHIPTESFILNRARIEPLLRAQGQFPIMVHVFDRERTENREPIIEHSFTVVGINLDDELVCVEKQDTREGVRVATLDKVLADCGVLNVFFIDEKSFQNREGVPQS